MGDHSNFCEAASVIIHLRALSHDPAVNGMMERIQACQKSDRFETELYDELTFLEVI